MFKINFIFFLLYINYSNLIIIKNSIYNIKIENSYLYYNKRNLTISDDFKYPNTFFRIKKASNYKNHIYYNIENLDHKNLKLNYIEDNKELNFNRQNKDSNLWNFIKVEDNGYVIQNKDNCFIVIDKLRFFCENLTSEKANIFKLNRIFSEINENKSRNYYEILKKEPIDVIIKYIDLNDPKLKRNGIHQIEKDYDNEELRYSVRSILINIPWIRKIFILMPNERVRFFKDYNLIKEKIIYVKDKDLLGYESSNSNAFQFRLWKMKKYGISNNVIVMDDDYFIGNKLEKNDFFYVKNGKVLPLITTSNFMKLDKKSAYENCQLYEKKLLNNREEQNKDEFFYSKYLTLSFILNIFNISNETIYLPDFTHNAIPININDLKEAYNIIYNSEFKYSTLDCTFRRIGYIQFQYFILSYTFVKYNRKIKNIPNKYIRLNYSISENYKVSLFCINKGPGNYTDLNFYKAKIIMEYLFPNPTKYEIVDNSFFNISYNVTVSMDKFIKLKEKEISNIIKIQKIYVIRTNIFLLIILISIKLII